MFDEWRLSDEYPTLFLVGRPVWVDTARVLPGVDLVAFRLDLEA